MACLAFLPLAVAAALPGVSAQDPAAPAQEVPTDRWASHRILGGLHVVAAARCGPFELLVQAAPEDQRDHRGRARGLLAPWLEGLGAILVRDHGVPAAGEALPVLVLTDREAHGRIQRLARARPERGAFWLPNPGVVVAHTDPEWSTRPHLLRTPLLEEAARALLNAGHAGEGGAPAERWYVDGLARYLAQHGDGDRPAVMELPPPCRSALEALREVYGEGRDGRVQRLSLTELVNLHDDRKRVSHLSEKARRAGEQAPGDERVRDLFDHQSALWMHYLQQGQGGRLREGIRAYGAAVLSDRGGLVALTRALPVERLHELDEPFAGWVQGLLTGIGPAGVGSPGLASAVGSSPWDAAQIRHGGLILPASSATDQVACALGLAWEGDLDQAIAFLERMGQGAAGPDGLTLEGERTRLEAARSARDAFLAELPGSKRRVRFFDGGQLVPASVVRIEDGTLVLAKNKAGRDRLAVAELTPAELRASLGRRLESYGPAWIGNYLDLLAGEEKWRRNLERDGPLADAGDELAALAREGGLRCRLAQLAMRPLAQEVRELDALLADVGALAAEDHPHLERARPGLRDLARRALLAHYRVTGLGGALAGSVTRRRERVTVTYSFDGAHELADWVEDPTYLAERWAESDATRSAPGFEVERGSLRGRGATCFRHLLQFDAPRVRYELVVNGDASTTVTAHVLVGICDDGNGNYVGAIGIHDLESVDGKRRATDFAKQRPIEMGRVYAVGLRHGGELATMSVDGESRRSVGTGRLRSGGVFVKLHSESEIEIRSLEIAGRLAPGAEERLRDAWLRRRLAAIGLAD